MKTTTSWLAELWYALKTLPRNPYRQHQLAQIRKPQVFIPVVLGYFVLTIAHVAYNYSILTTPLDIKPFLILDLALQMTYIQQLSFMYIVAAIIIPLLTITRIIKDISQNRLSFVQLSPLTQHQIIIGILSRDLILVMAGIVLFLPLTLLSLLMRNVELTYVIVMTGDLLLTALFLSIASIAVGLLCHNNLTVGISIVLIFSSANIVWQELFANRSDEKEVQTYLRIRPFWLFSRQGILTAPIRVQSLFMSMYTSAPDFILTANGYKKNSGKKDLPSFPSYKAGDLYNEAITLYNKVLSELYSDSAFKQAIEEFEKSLQAFQSSLIVLDRFLNAEAKTHDPLSLYSDNWKLLRFSEQELGKLLKERKVYLTQGIDILKKDLMPNSKRSLRELVRFFIWWRYLNVQKKITNEDGLRMIFASNLELKELELEEFNLFIEKLQETRGSLRSFILTKQFENPHTIFRDIPCLLRFAETAIWWKRLDKTTTNAQLNLITAKFKNLLSQVAAVKLPISLVNTNFIGLSFQQEKEIWWSFLSNNLIKVIIVLFSYLFIYQNIFSHPPLYLAPLTSLILSLIVGTVLGQLYAIEDLDTYLDFSQAVFAQKAFLNLYIVFILLLFMILPFLLFYHAIPLSKTKSRRLWERFVVLFTPYLFVFLSWYSHSPNSPKFYEWTKVFLSLLVSFEIVKQVLSFKFSKRKTGFAAVVFAILMTMLISFFQ